MALGLVVFFGIFFVVPFLVGLLFWDDLSMSNRMSFVQCIMYYYCLGFISIISLFELLCVPMAALHLHLHNLFNVFNAIIAILIFIVIYKIIKKRTVFSNVSYKNFFSKNCVLFLILALILIGIQLFFSVYYQSNWMSGDDAEYVTRTSSSLYTDYIVSNAVNEVFIDFNPKRSMCSWEIFIAWLCKCTGISVPTMVHTVLNISLIIVAYIVFYVLGCELFERLEERIEFLSTVAFVNIFGLYSHYSLTFRWLMTIWQGKAVFMVIVLQITFFVLLRIFRNTFEYKNIIIILLLSIASCALTPTGAGMYVGTITIIISSVSIIKRRIGYFLYIVVGATIPAVFMVIYLISR